ncbi:MAG: glycosyltransferase family 4 protein [archaeon]
MNLIKIFLQFPWRYTDSSYYKYLREFPLKKIRYINEKDFKFILNKNELKVNNWIKQLIKRLIIKFCSSMSNAHYTRINKEYDLIHCAHCISKNKSPWVCDIEFVGQFWASGLCGNSSSKKHIIKYIMGPYCKKILAWSKWTRNGILKEFPEIECKLDILYPAVPLREMKKRSYLKINLLFIGRNFELKGGVVALDIFDKLTKKYDNVSATIVSDVSNEIIKKYELNKKILFCGLMPHEKLFKEIYPRADIFVYPTFSDTFGFAILEAQSFGLPVVAMKTRSTHTIKETISEGKTGFIVENLEADAVNKIASEEVKNQITGKIEGLITNKKKLGDMSKNCVREIGSGKFSIKKRNKKLKKIYSEALKSE